MGVNLDSNSGNNKPTHVLAIETEHGKLQISLFPNNKLHLALMSAFGDGTDITPFLKAVMQSAKIEKAGTAPAADQDLISMFRGLNV